MQLHPIGRIVGSVVLIGLCLTKPHFAFGEARLPEGVVLMKPRTPDFIVAEMQAMNEKLRGDLQPQDNAVVWLLQALGTECIGPELKEPTLEMLGIQSLSPNGPELEKLETFGRRREKVGKNYAKEADDFNKGLLEGPSRQWKREEFESYAAYLDESAAAFDLIAAAVQQKGYYWPQISTETPQRLISTSYGLELRLVFLTKLLTSRANLRIQEGDIPGAQTDLMTLHRLAALMSHGSPFDVSVVKAHLIDSFAYSSERVLLESGKLTAETAKSWLKQLSDAPRIAPAAIIADQGERAIIRQEIAFVRLNPEELKSMFEDPREVEKAEAAGKPKPPKPLPKIDWKIAVQKGEEIQDQVRDALATGDPSEQAAKFDALDREYAEWDEKLDATTQQMLDNLSKKNDWEGASRYLGESMARALKTHYRQRQATDDRSNSRRDQIMVGLALICQQRETGEFPQMLSEVNPEILSKIPDDPNTHEPFAYQKEAKESALLISWGTNRMDDAGKFPSDDQIIRLR